MFGTNIRIKLKTWGFTHIPEICVHLFNGVPLKECTQCIAMFTLGTAKINMFLSWYFAILVYHTGDHKYMCEKLKNYEFESIYLILAVGNSWG